jgi:hypothetical protein
MLCHSSVPIRVIGYRFAVQSFAEDIPVPRAEKAPER